MRYNPQSVAGLHVALGGLPGKMRVEADPGIVAVTTVGELRRHGVAREFGCRGATLTAR